MSRRTKLNPGVRRMARNFPADLARLARRVDRHEEQIGELLEMSTEDHKTVVLHSKELRFLRELSEVQAARITHVQASVSRLRRGRARRR